MGIRTLTLLVVVFAALPARADIVLSYHLSSFNGPATADIPNDLPLGSQITDLTMMVGETRYVQVAITGNANAPQIVNGQNQASWNGSNRMPVIGFTFQYPVALVTQPYVQPTIPTLSENWPNGRSQLPFSTGHPISFTQYNMGATVITGLTTTGGLQANLGILPTTVIATLKVNAIASGASTFSIIDPNPILTAGIFGLSDGSDLDQIVFAPSHANFPLSMYVTAVPEPSSLALSCCAAAVIGWRRLRRGNVAAKC